ncbi:MAG: helicase, partial [Actinobacteria bacterium]|nr:helicase [Actinomycetota bacterium]
PGWTWNLFDTKWEEGFRHLESYAAEHGHCRVTRAYVAGDNYRLGDWVVRQRSQRDTTASERISRLETLSGWTWDALDVKWEEGFKRLSEYVAELGHSRVKAGHKTQDQFTLGRWVSFQRAGRENMSADRRQRLDAIPGWTWEAAQDANWEEGFRHLKTYVAVNSHCQIPAAHVTPENYPLGAWVRFQRSKRASLATDRSDRLEGVPGWKWDADFETRWENGLSQLEQYIAANGDCLVQASYETVDGYKLGQWVSVQRSKRDTMPAERRERLDALTGWKWKARPGPRTIAGNAEQDDEPD